MTARRLLPAALALIAATWPAAAQERSAKTALTIHVGGSSFPSNPIYDAAIREALVATVRDPIDYFAEYLDTQTVAVEAERHAFEDYLRQKYRGRRIDVVIAVTDAGMKFALAHRAELFPDAAVVFGAASRPTDADRMAGGGVTGVFVGNAYAATMKLALDLHPSTRRVFVIANASSQVSASAVVRDTLRPFTQQIPLTYLEQRPLTELLAAVKAIPPDSVVLYVWHGQSDPGNLIYSDEIAELVARASPVPVYGTSDLYIGRGIVGGVVRSTAETGTRLGELAAEILNGARARDLPIEPARVVPIVDWRQLKRWGISEAALPPDTKVQFRTPTLWESYRGYLIVTALVITAQLTLIAALLMQRWRLRRADAIIRARESTLRSSYLRIRQLAGRLIYAQENARATIARDLHDGVCQDLLGATVAINTLKTSAGLRDVPAAQQELTQIESEVLGTYDAIRRLSHDLHPSTLRLVGLARALKSHCGEIAKRHGVQVDFSVQGDLGQLDLDVAVCIFRIAQESMRNGIVHGKATRLGVNLSRVGTEIAMTVADNGCGFDVEAMRTSGDGFGLVSMEERAHLFGGTVSVQSGSHGTTVSVRAPASAPTADAAAG